MRCKVLAASITSCLIFTTAASADDICIKQGIHDNLKYVQYFLSRPQDGPGCAMHVVDGRITAPASVTNPALACPDMFAWKLFAEAVTAEFWRKWAADQEMWPANGPDSNARPLPLCGPSGPVGSCCNPDSANNPGYDDPAYKANFCPYFPGDHLSPADEAPLRLGAPPSKAHTLGFAANPKFKRALQSDAALALEILKAPDPSKGRTIRQSMAELVFRNKAFFDFVFRSNLYNAEGIVKVFETNSKNLENGPPYRIANGAGAVSEIIFPSDAVMIKSDWLNRERAEAMGLHEDPNNPYIKMNILTPVLDDNGQILKPGEHWLVAMHFSSKDIPNWVWTTFEHVNNPGRCDFTGCNDSYGYSSPDKTTAGQAQNYTRPHQACDGLLLPSYVLDPGETYPGGERSPGLSEVFKALHIGISDNPTLTPKPTDRAWLSYRLKGAQVDFADAIGRATHLGNSVTEAGFVTSSSCMTCHARASVNAAGTVPLPLGVFDNGLTETGYLAGDVGVPVPEWYNKSGQPPTLQALQTDFVWGFLLANPIKAPAALAAERAERKGFAPLFGSARSRALGR